MSWEKYVSVFCDGCSTAEMTDRTTVAEAREFLTEWETGSERDLCPDCAYENEQ